MKFRIEVLCVGTIEAASEATARAEVESELATLKTSDSDCESAELVSIEQIAE